MSGVSGTEEPELDANTRTLIASTLAVRVEADDVWTTVELQFRMPTNTANGGPVAAVQRMLEEMAVRPSILREYRRPPPSRAD